MYISINEFSNQTLTCKVGFKCYWTPNSTMLGFTLRTYDVEYVRVCLRCLYQKIKLTL